MPSSPRPLTTYRVTIDITIDDSFEPPEYWDWVEMLNPKSLPGLVIGDHAVTRIPIAAEEPDDLGPLAHCARCGCMQVCQSCALTYHEERVAP